MTPRKQGKSQGGSKKSRVTHIWQGNQENQAKGSGARICRERSHVSVNGDKGIASKLGSGETEQTRLRSMRWQVQFDRNIGAGGKYWKIRFERQVDGELNKKSVTIVMDLNSSNWCVLAWSSFRGLEHRRTQDYCKRKLNSSGFPHALDPMRTLIIGPKYTLGGMKWYELITAKAPNITLATVKKINWILLCAQLNTE